MLSEHQYGFRSELSTSLAIYDIHENFLQNTEKRLTICAVICDLYKAIDTLDHEMLLWKLEHFYGIRGLPHKLITSYLQDRQQYTAVGGFRSTTQGVSLGVPQGSSLGPPLFALYVNGLPQASNLTPTLFADDTLLTIACANSTNLQNGVNNELQKVDEWMRYNKLSLNYSKTTYMLLNSNLSQSCNISVKINDNKIKHTTCTKYLGVYIDQHLSWTDHIRNLEIKLSRSVAMLYRIRYYLSNNALRSVYCSLTYSHLQYAIGVYSGAGKTALNRLNVLHHKVLRAMTYSSYKSRVSPLYKNLNLKINDIYILEIGKFMHNLHWGRIPVNFDRLFTSVNQAHSHATRAVTRGGYIWQLASTVKAKDL